jgi:hypothetical protein
MLLGACVITIVNYSPNTFIVQTTGACIIKLIRAVIYGFHNKLECLSLNTRLGWKGLPGTNTHKFYNTDNRSLRSLTHRRGRESQEPSSQLVKMMEGQLTLANLLQHRHPFIPKRRSLVEADSDEKKWLFFVAKIIEKNGQFLHSF